VRAKNSHAMQSPSREATVPQASPRENVPAIAQQARPPFFPPLSPCAHRADAAGQGPADAAFAPPGSRPQRVNSQQLRLPMV